MPIFRSFKSSVKKLSKSRDHADIPDQVLDQALEIAADALKTRKPGQSKITIRPSQKANENDKHDQTLMVIVSGDYPFLIDSVTAACVDEKYAIEGVLHNTLLVERDGRYGLQTLKVKTKKDESPLKRESFLVITLEGFLGEERTQSLCTMLEETIQDVRFSTRDWQAMRQKTIEAIDNLEQASFKDKELLAEYQDFLRYIHDHNFTLLGYREYKLKDNRGAVESSIVKKAGLGLFSDDKRPVYINRSRQMLPPELQKKRVGQPPLTVSKVNKKSTVHRRVPLDAIAVKTYDKKGNITGEKLFIGLFTSVTYSRSIQDIPFLRHKVRQVLEKTGYGENSHNYRALMHILEKYPRDELFQIDVNLLTKYTQSIMVLQEQPKLALYVREDEFKRYVSCLVYIPREKYQTDSRLRIQSILEQEFEGECESFQTVLDDSPLGRVIYRIRTDEAKIDKKYNHKKIEQRLIEETRGWDERLRDILLNNCDSEGQALTMLDRYVNAFPAGYQVREKAEYAYFDMLKLEEVLERKTFALDLYQHTGATGLNLKIYHPETQVVLSDILPILENFGFQVLSEQPYEITVPNHPAIWIHDFSIAYKNPDHARAVKDIKHVFEDGLRAIWMQQAENDPLNALIAKSTMPWRDVMILRALVKYMRQAKIQYSPEYMMQAVIDHPDIADLLVTCFDVRHNPDHTESTRDKKMKQIGDKILAALEDVASFDQDKILRSMFHIIEASLRTNAYQHKDYISIKIDSGKVDILPKPKPFVEIFVYSPRVEGIHLRGGKVARGGLRWSDRHEDFRTEVLGLMKAQNVKNAVIIPVGSKGGFVVKNPPKSGGREAFQKEGIECYKIFIRGLLDITDNLKGDAIIPPHNTVRHDGDDPYLVVAADKGTATFSDIANGISAEYEFWLGDAFASGGSAGYDHKVMGITARGAWESVKRHFRELGKNIQVEPFSVIGVGDMGGDVFGNGMLLSEQIRLIGAFNHLHIFCDPDPDIAKSFKERQRLFKEVKGWDHYNEKLLSKGGRIFNRSEKSLTLTPEIQKSFGIEKKQVSPQELMHAMLQAQTDLLWFGGIGTYIKAPNETHADVGDKANDAIRVEAHQVRAKVIGEGANLGATHAARICMSLLGIKCYADFIDNSGGVNSSDLEVNIKILFQQIMQKKSAKLSLQDRNKILAKMTDDVAALVLRNNYQQSQAISIAAYHSFEKLSSHAALIEYLEGNFGLDRKLENLPDSAGIERRAQDHTGLAPPELSTLISYTKIKLYQDLLGSYLPTDPAFQSWIFEYFPQDIAKKYPKEIESHKLRGEIVATQMANSLVNRMGPTYVMNQTARTGAPACTIARVYFIVREIFDLRSLYQNIENLDNKATATAQIEAFDMIASFIDYGSTWFLKHYKTENLKENELVKTGNHYKKNILKLIKSLDTVLPNSMKQSIADIEKRYTDQNFPKTIAKRLALLPAMNTVWDIIKISDEQNHDLKTVAKVYYGLSEKLCFAMLRQRAREMESHSRWEAETLKAIIERLYKTQGEMTKRIVLETCSQKDCPDNPVADWMGRQSESLKPVLSMLKKIQDTETPDFAMLTSIEARLSQLV